MGTYFERYARLTIERGKEADWSQAYVIDFSTSYDCLNLKFKVDMYAAATDANKASIGVCGLTRDKIAELASYMDFVTNYEKYVRCKLEVGYKDIKSLSHIFTGNIVKGTPTQPPDVWMNMECVFSGEKKHQQMTLSSSEQMTVKEIYQQGAQAIGFPLDWQVKDGQANAAKITGFDYTGAREKFVAEMNRMYPPVHGYLDPVTKAIVCVDRDKPQGVGTTKTISKDTGLIGVPVPNVRGCELDVFLDTSLRKMQVVNIKSEVWPAMNGLYYIQNMTHEGEIRGANWKTHLTCIRLPAVSG